MREAQGFPRAAPYDPHCPPHHITAATSQGGMPLQPARTAFNTNGMAKVYIDGLAKRLQWLQCIIQVINITTIVQLDCFYI